MRVIGGPVLKDEVRESAWPIVAVCKLLLQLVNAILLQLLLLSYTSIPATVF